MLNAKLNNLNTILKSFDSLLIAYSGGVDSTFLLKVARDLLGDSVLAVTAKSETYSQSECNEAIQIARQYHVNHMIISTKELEYPHFKSNPINRCYYCKNELFKKLKELAQKKNIQHIVDGTNFDDTDDFRPGLKALKELDIRSPLKEAGLTKKEIRLLSHEMGLPTWNKPALACLASRFPYGTEITPPKLNRVEQAETFLHELGFKQVRVRHHNNIARIEVSQEEIERISSPDYRDIIIIKLKELDYQYITLDLQGFRTGSMNEVLSGTIII